ncbi:RDD family protein [bacterium]|nr:RDD family protein [bacterium]MBU1638621.1 RDD family protein [bacterium]MBU1919697.1 RDD family protein [bacterium]
MTMRDSYLADVAKHITAHREQKEQFINDLRAHFEEGQAAGDSDMAVIDRLGQAEDVAAEFMTNIQIKLAGFWERTLAFLVDMALCIYTMVFMYGIVLGVPYMIFGGFSSESLLKLAEDVFTLKMLGSLTIILIPMLILVVLGTGALFLLYFPILEAQFGQTLGKRLLGLRVLKERKTAIGMKEAFLRRLSYYVEILALDALFIPFTDKKQRAFDIVAKTIVVRDPGYRRNAVAILLAIVLFTIPFFALLALILTNDPHIIIRL